MNNQTEINPEYPNLCAGQGKYFSLSKAENYPQMNQYHTLNWNQVWWYAANPLNVGKDAAWWVIPSTLNARDARLKKAQLERGQFWMLGADIDYGNLDLATVVEGAKAILDPGTEFLVYATKSSRPDAKRWRFFMPCGSPIPAHHFHHIASIYNELLAAALDVKVDPITERLQQLLYMPNRGAHYEWYHEAGVPWGLTDTVERAKAVVAASGERLLADPQRVAANERQRERGKYLEAFNTKYRVEMLLERYGFETKDGVHWHWPGQTSNSFGTEIKPDGSWVTASQTVQELLGRNGGDSFDIFVAMEGGGDFQRCYAALVTNTTVDPPTRIAGFVCNGEYVQIGAVQ